MFTRLKVWGPGPLDDRDIITQFKIASTNQPTKILYKDDLQNEFKYVESKTGVYIKDIHELYE